jgi:outer membrane immunogenic protein
MNMTGKILLAATALAGFSGSAMAADLSYQRPAPEPVIQAPAATDWDGAYIGANVSYGWGTATDSTATDTANLTGYGVGGQIGYNFHLTDNLVLGVEGDLNWNNQKATYGASSNTYKVNWDGSVRGRLGVDLDGILPYAEAGIAFANATQNVAGTDFSATHTGWTAGAGVEFKIADPVSLNVEYRYANYGTQTFNGNTVGLTDNSVRVGVNYHF